MIAFRCGNCGGRIRAGDDKAGVKGKCPGCGEVVVVPRSEETLEADQVRVEDITLDRSVEDIPLKSEPIDRYGEWKGVSQDPAAAMLAGAADMGAPAEAGGEAPKRPLPWFVDIALYPGSSAGLITLGVVAFGPALIHVISQHLLMCCGVWFVVLILNVLLAGYGYWYFAECIRDSAKGGIRAPETIASAPGGWEIIGQFFQIAVCAAVFLGPGVGYFFWKGADATFLAVIGCGAFLFPMGLLGVVMFGSMSGLNPLLIVGSIVSTFLPYCAVAAVFVGAGLLVGAIDVPANTSLLIGSLLYAGFLYLAMVASHVLGLFYNKYADKLNWEV